MQEKVKKLSRESYSTTVDLAIPGPNDCLKQLAGSGCDVEMKRRTQFEATWQSNVAMWEKKQGKFIEINGFNVLTGQVRLQDCIWHERVPTSLQWLPTRASKSLGAKIRLMWYDQE